MAEPLEVHPHRLKLRILGGMAGLAAGVLIALALGPDRPEGASPLPALALAAVLTLAARGLWSRARDPRPLVRVSAEGVEDSLYGPIPWSAIESYRLSRSVLAPGFGYDLKNGLQPSRNTTLFRLDKLRNRLSNLPARSFRRKLTEGGAEAMLAAFRAHRPDLER